MLQSAKLEGKGCIEREVVGLGICPAGFKILASVRCFLTAFLPFGMVMRIMCHYKLQACNLLFFILRRVTVKKLP